MEEKNTVNIALFLIPPSHSTAAAVRQSKTLSVSQQFHAKSQLPIPIHLHTRLVVPVLAFSYDGW